ncbi:hypothetical protein IFM89_006349 [Coptis chinensis]|uniref:Uncharacterized protein n=1 Tax=Coptis chinensis TaxID=261450 RepID=A0A835LTI7_9MAGN|nr:hypothetical protein IFM89_006349 [Coptis chinensis]
MKNIRASVQGPWCVMGHINNVIFSHERLGDRAVHPRETLPFANSLNVVGLVDHTVSGCFFTWNSGGDSVRKWSKIDRCLVNSGWFSLQNGLQRWSSSDKDFAELVKECWIVANHGSPTFMLSKKLKSLKGVLKGWSRSVGSNNQRLVQDTREELEAIQERLQLNPLD